MSRWWWFRQHFSCVRDYNYRVMHVLTFFYKVSFIFVETDLHFGHFLTVNNRRSWPLLRKKFIPRCIFLEYGTRLETNSARSFQNAFYKCSRALNIIFQKCIFDERRHFSVLNCSSFQFKYLSWKKFTVLTGKTYRHKSTGEMNILIMTFYLCLHKFSKLWSLFPRVPMGNSPYLYL